MKFVVLLTLAVLAVAFGAPAEEREQRINGENGWYVPQVDGSFYWVPMEDDSAPEHAEMDSDTKDFELDSYTEDFEMDSYNVVPMTKRRSVVLFYLYTRSNPTEPQLIEDTFESVKASNFNRDHATRFVVHGWTDSYLGDVNRMVRDAWLSKGDYNIIVVDWSSRSQTVNYASSVKHVPAIGKAVAAMIDFLHMKFQVPFNSLTLIGHSLGAHVCGFAGKNVKRGRVGTIIGLDPALPLYDIRKPTRRLSACDAQYVESIHTNGGKLGFLKPIGMSAFYPNGGRKQPGCGLDATGSCSHGRSFLYYSEALRENTFPSIKCSDYNEAISKDCGATYSPVHMGAQTNAYMASGHFYVPVNKESPFGKGV